MKTIRRVIRNVPPHWVGDGFPVRSLFSYAEENRCDPFLLLDYAGPHQFAPAEAHRGVGEHPHRGFETVTIVYQGELEHRDSSGSHGTIGPGDVQWMTAAAGIVHEEFHSEEFTRSGGTLEMIQLWVNLPAEHKTTPPRYQGLSDAEIPRVSLSGEAGTVRVIAGQFEEHNKSAEQTGPAKQAGPSKQRGPANTFTPINVWDVQLSKEGEHFFELPDGHTSLIVVQSGVVRIEGEKLEATDLAELDRAGTEVRLFVETPVRLLMLSGEPIGEPVVGQGPFVMNTRDEIRQAIHDYQQGRMGRLA